MSYLIGNPDCRLSHMKAHIHFQICTDYLETRLKRPRDVDYTPASPSHYSQTISSHHNILNMASFRYNWLLKQYMYFEIEKMILSPQALEVIAINHKKNASNKVST